MDLLSRVDESGPSKKVVDAARRGMQNVALDSGHAYVINEPAPDAVATTIDQEQPAAGFEHSVHLGDGAVLVRVVVKAVGAGDHVEHAVRKRKTLAVTLHGGDVQRVRTPARSTLDQHRRDEVDPTHPALRQALSDSGGEDAGAAANVQHR